MMRQRAGRVLHRYVRVRPGPLWAAMAFYTQHVLARGQRSLLGLHLRGTDKLRNIGGRIIGPREYRPLIQRFLTRRPHALLFLATDSPSFLAEMHQEYGDRLIVYDALRSERNAFADRKIANNYKKGTDALVDALLLSCSNLLIKPASALSEFSVYWNTALHNHTVELQYEEGMNTEETLSQFFNSARDRKRDFDRCAPIMAELAATRASG